MLQGTFLSLRSVLTILISLVWLINGLFCKVMNLVPRHQLIVARILGEEYAGILTKTIGVLEIQKHIRISRTPIVLVRMPAYS